MERYLPFCIGCKNSLCLLPENLSNLRENGLRPGNRLFFSTNKLMYQAGETANGIFCIYSGAIRVYKPSSPNPETTIHKAAAGEVIGFNSISGGIYTNSAIALEDTYACFIPLTDIHQMLKVLSAATELILSGKC